MNNSRTVPNHTISMVNVAGRPRLRGLFLSNSVTTSLWLMLIQHTNRCIAIVLGFIATKRETIATFYTCCMLTILYQILMLFWFPDIDEREQLNDRKHVRLESRSPERNVCRKSHMDSSENTQQPQSTFSTRNLMFWQG